MKIDIVPRSCYSQASSGLPEIDAEFAEDIFMKSVADLFQEDDSGSSAPADDMHLFMTSLRDFLNGDEFLEDGDFQALLSGIKDTMVDLEASLQDVNAKHLPERHISFHNSLSNLFSSFSDIVAEKKSAFSSRDCITINKEMARAGQLRKRIAATKQHYPDFSSFPAWAHSPVKEFGRTKTVDHRKQKQRLSEILECSLADWTVEELPGDILKEETRRRRNGKEHKSGMDEVSRSENGRRQDDKERRLIAKCRSPDRIPTGTSEKKSRKAKRSDKDAKAVKTGRPKPSKATSIEGCTRRRHRCNSNLHSSRSPTRGRSSDRALTTECAMSLGAPTVQYEMPPVPGSSRYEMSPGNITTRQRTRGNSKSRSRSRPRLSPLAACLQANEEHDLHTTLHSGSSGSTSVYTMQTTQTGVRSDFAPRCPQRRSSSAARKVRQRHRVAEARGEPKADGLHDFLEQRSERKNSCNRAMHSRTYRLSMTGSIHSSMF